MAIAIDSARIAPDGPSTMAAMVTPNACPVVPPGSGRLNIITTNENAAKTEISGMTRASSTRFSRLSAEYHPATAPAYITAQVEGLRYPSGMCIRRSPRTGLIIVSHVRTKVQLHPKGSAVLFGTSLPHVVYTDFIETGVCCFHEPNQHRHRRGIDSKGAPTHPAENQARDRGPGPRVTGSLRGAQRNSSLLRKRRLER